jgi:transcriptional regulator with XRE-family HTH domain
MLDTGDRPTHTALMSEQVLPDAEVDTLSRRLRASMRAASLRDETMAELLGVSYSTIRNYREGRTTPQWATIVMWAEVTGVSPEWLRDGDPA